MTCRRNFAVSERENHYSDARRPSILVESLVYPSSTASVASALIVLLRHFRSLSRASSNPRLRAASGNVRF